MSVGDARGDFRRRERILSGPRGTCARRAAPIALEREGATGDLQGAQGGVNEGRRACPRSLRGSALTAMTAVATPCPRDRDRIAGRAAVAAAAAPSASDGRSSSGPAVPRPRDRSPPRARRSVRRRRPRRRHRRARRLLRRTPADAGPHALDTRAGSSPTVVGFARAITYGLGLGASAAARRSTTTSTSAARSLIDHSTGTDGFNSLYVGPEGGYDFDLKYVVVRPYLGLGLLLRHGRLAVRRVSPGARCSLGHPPGSNFFLAWAILRLVSAPLTPVGVYFMAGDALRELAHAIAVGLSAVRLPSVGAGTSLPRTFPGPAR